jgi:Sigma-70, region 4
MLLARPSEQRDKAFEMYRAGGRTHKQVAEALNIPETTISSWSYRYKWKVRAQAMALAQAKPSRARLKAPAVSQIDPDLTFPAIQGQYKSIMAAQALRIAKVIERFPDHMLIAGSEKIEKADKVARKALNLEQPPPDVVVNVALLSQGSQPRSAGVLPSSEVAIPAELVTTDV